MVWIARSRGIEIVTCVVVGSVIGEAWLPSGLSEPAREPPAPSPSMLDPFTLVLRLEAAVPPSLTNAVVGS